MKTNIAKETNKEIFEIIEKLKKKASINNMIYRIASRLFYVIGVVCMFIPMLTHRIDIMYVFIPGGMLLAMIGILLIEPKKKKRKQNNDIIDDGEF